MAEKETKTIIVNPKVESEETIFPTLGLSNFEKQMKAFNSYSALQKFRDERGISPAFNYDTLGAYTAGNLLDLKNYGTSKFSVDFAGKVSCVGLAAGSQKITGVLDPTSNQDAATKKYVDDNENTGLWEIDGTETQLKTADEIDMRSKKIINLTDPTANQDGATKKYVDDNTYNSSARVYLSADFDYDSSGVHTIEFDTESWDVGSEFNTGNYIFTAGSTGYYLVNLQVTIDGVFAGSSTSYIALYKTNESTILNKSFAIINTKRVELSAVVYLEATNTLGALIYEGTADTINSDSTMTFMDITRIL